MKLLKKKIGKFNSKPSNHLKRSKDLYFNLTIIFATTDDLRENTRPNSEVKQANRHSLIPFLFKNRNIYATLNASNLNLTEERDSRR